MLGPSKKPERVLARGLVCYCAVKEIEMTGTAVSELLGLTQSSASGTVLCGEMEVLDGKLNLDERLRIKNYASNKAMSLRFLSLAISQLPIPAGQREIIE